MRNNSKDYGGESRLMRFRIDEPPAGPVTALSLLRRELEKEIYGNGYRDLSLHFGDRHTGGTDE